MKIFGYLSAVNMIAMSYASFHEHVIIHTLAANGIFIFFFAFSLYDLWAVKKVRQELNQSPRKVELVILYTLTIISIVCWFINFVWVPAEWVAAVGPFVYVIAYVWQLEWQKDCILQIPLNNEKNLDVVDDTYTDDPFKTDADSFEKI